MVTGKLNAKLSVNRLASTEIKPQEAVALVSDTFSGEFSRSKEKEFTACISDAIRKAHPAVRIVSPDDFRNVAMPGLIHGNVSVLPWEQLMEKPEFREQITPSGIRYVVLLSGDTHGRERKAYSDWIPIASKLGGRATVKSKRVGRHESSEGRRGDSSNLG